MCRTVCTCYSRCIGAALYWKRKYLSSGCFRPTKLNSVDQISWSSSHCTRYYYFKDPVIKKVEVAILRTYSQTLYVQIHSQIYRRHSCRRYTAASEVGDRYFGGFCGDVDNCLYFLPLMVYDFLLRNKCQVNKIPQLWRWKVELAAKQNTTKNLLITYCLL